MRSNAHDVEQTGLKSNEDKDEVMTDSSDEDNEQVDSSFEPFDLTALPPPH